jgi:hypothetical protein
MSIENAFLSKIVKFSFIRWTAFLLWALRLYLKERILYIVLTVDLSCTITIVENSTDNM